MPEAINLTVSNLEAERDELIQRRENLIAGASSFKSVKNEAGRLANDIMRLNINIQNFKNLSQKGYTVGEIDQINKANTLQAQRTAAKQQTSKETGLSVRELEQRAADVKAQTGGLIQQKKEVVKVQNIPAQEVKTIQEQSKQPVEINQPINTVEEARDPTFSEATSQTKIAFQNKGIWGGIVTGAQSYSGAIFKRQTLKNKWDDFWKQGDELRYDLYKSQDYVGEKEVKRAAELGSPSDLRTYTRIQEEKIGSDSDKKIEAVQNKIEKGSSDYAEKQYALFAEGKITAEQANANVESFNNKLLEQGQKEYSDYISPKVEKAQKDIDATARKGQISSIAFGTVTSLALGFGVGSVLAGASKGVQIGANVIGGGLFAKETLGLTKEVVKGDAGAIEVVGFGLQTGAFITGASIGAAGRTPTTQTNLEMALRNSDIVSKGKGVIREVDLAKLEIPEVNKIELRGRLKAGETLRKVELEIKPSSTSDSTLINKEMPYRKIEFVQVVDNLGNVVESVAIGKVEVAGKSGKTYTQDVLTKSTGAINPEGVLETDTLTVIAEKGKKGKSAPKKAIFTTEASKGVMTKQGNLKIVRTSTGVKLVNEIESRGKPLTEKQLRNLVDMSLGEKGKKISETEFLEIQRRTKMKIDIIQRGSEALIRKQEKALGYSIGISKQVLEVPKSKSTSPKTPFSKTFPRERAIDFKKINKGVQNIGQEIKQIGRNIKNAVPDLKLKRNNVNLETGARAALERGVREVVKANQLPQVAPILTQRQINEMLNQGRNFKQLENINQNIFADVKMDSKINSQFRDLQNQFNPQKINQQIKQLQQLEQPQQFQQPNINIPNFNVPTFPQFPTPINFRGSGGVDSSLKELNKAIKKYSNRDSAYTASLQEAFFGGDPFEVSQKQFEALNKKVFSGLEVRPLLKIKKTKKKSSKKKRK